MWRRVLLPFILPAASAWVAWQERRIIRDGIALTMDQCADALAAGVQKPERVRVLSVRRIPWPMRRTAGLTARYGIFLRADFAHDRRLLVHELAHTAQYERAGGIEPFLRDYVSEWLVDGYPFGPLEFEAVAVAESICGRI